MSERTDLKSPLIAADVSHLPRLLVSVRSVDEAEEALRGGADILDVKEPSRGSLGMAEDGVLCGIAEHLVTSNSSRPLSSALGEVIEWRERDAIPALPDRVTYAKLGLSGLGDSASWRDEWLQVRHRFESQRQSPLHWVAVAYADVEQASAPPLADVMEAAVATGCSGLLIDTFHKGNQTLADWCDQGLLNDVADRCHASRLFLALAGRLSRDSLRELINVAVDVIAIRSAACVESDRRASVHGPSVCSFREAIHRAFAKRGSVRNGLVPTS